MEEKRAAPAAQAGREEPPIPGPPRGCLPKGPARSCESAPPPSPRRLGSLAGRRLRGRDHPAHLWRNPPPSAPPAHTCREGAGGRAGGFLEGGASRVGDLGGSATRGDKRRGKIPPLGRVLAPSGWARLPRRTLGAFAAPLPLRSQADFFSHGRSGRRPFKVIAAGPPFPDGPLGGAARQAPGFRALRLSREAEPEPRRRVLSHRWP